MSSGAASRGIVSIIDCHGTHLGDIEMPHAGASELTGIALGPYVAVFLDTLDLAESKLHAPDARSFLKAFRLLKVFSVFFLMEVTAQVSL